jgi:hypothetical protein
MIQWLKNQYWGNNIDRNMTYIAIVLAYHFMLRSSEYIHSKTNPHAICCKDVEFISNDDVRIKPWNLNNISNISIFAAVFVIRSSKSDRDGKGRYLHLSRDSTLESDFLEDLIRWCKESNIKEDDPLFCRYKFGRRKLLTTQMVSIALKLTASAFGFDSTYFASHSLRIGGMTTMIASGVDRNVARKVGGWSETSNCDQIYDRNTTGNRGTLSVNPQTNIFSSSDVKRLVPILR